MWIQASHYNVKYENGYSFCWRLTIIDFVCVCVKILVFKDLKWALDDNKCVELNIQYQPMYCILLFKSFK